MLQQQTTHPDWIFETSWEVCNRVGGIYAVLSTRAASMSRHYGDNVVFFGPDVWTKSNPSPYFEESQTLLAEWRRTAAREGLQVRIGRWLVPRQPIAVLINFVPFMDHKNQVYAHMWEQYGVSSMEAYGDYDESSMFGYAVGVAMESLYHHLHLETKKVCAHFNEWMTTFGLFYVREHLPAVGTLFTTHATGIGRSIAGNDKPLYDFMTCYNGDQMARELNMVSKHSTEKTAAHVADCFTTVSDITGDECTQLLDKRPDIITPNGFESDFVPKGHALSRRPPATATGGRDNDRRTHEQRRTLPGHQRTL